VLKRLSQGRPPHPVVWASVMNLLLPFGGRADQEGLPLVTPGTLVLSTERPSGLVVVGNAGARFQALLVENAYFQQDPEGRLTPLDPEGAPGSAANLLRVGPREMVLDPGEGRELRVAFRPPAGLPPGEYRLHLSLVAEDFTEGVRPPAAASSNGREGSGVGASVALRLARGVRVLVRHGVSPEGGRLRAGPLRVEEETLHLLAEVERRGVTSLMARLELDIRDEAGQTLETRPWSGVNLYPEVAGRSFSLSVSRGSLPSRTQSLCARLVMDDPDAGHLPKEEVCWGLS